MSPIAFLDVVLAGVRVGKSTDPRPCVVVDFVGGVPILAPCSSEFDLYREGRDFPIRKGDPGFAATGLPWSSYVIDYHAITAEEGSIKKRYGRLQGKLAKAFKKWYGF